MGPARHEVSEQLRLAAPVVVVNLSLMTMGVVDSAMAGRLSAQALASIRYGHAWSFVFLVVGMGIVMALDPLVAQARGARDPGGMARAVQRGLAVALVASLPLALPLQALDRAVEASRSFGLDVPQALVPDAQGYASVTAWGVPALLVFVALRHTLQALGHLRVIVVVAVFGNLVNVLGNGLLMFGWWGAPAMGAVGCAWSSVIVEWAMVLALLALARRRLGPLVWPLHPEALRVIPLLRLLRVGLPIGITLGIEVGAFNAVQWLVAEFGVAATAGHGVAIVIASMAYMVPLGISTAAAVRVGHGVGAGDPEAVRRAARTALMLGVSVMALSGSLFLLLPEALASIFSADPDVLAVAVTLLPVAAAFALFDGLQCVAGGVLRGTADTTVPTLCNLVGYFVVGLPLGVVWSFRWGGGPIALWWGLTAGLASVAAALLWRTARRLAGPLQRYDAEGTGVAPAVTGDPLQDVGPDGGP